MTSGHASIVAPPTIASTDARPMIMYPISRPAW